jgi:thiol-disulfide isomerase/thioredoxin
MPTQDQPIKTKSELKQIINEADSKQHSVFIEIFAKWCHYCQAAALPCATFRKSHDKDVWLVKSALNPFFSRLYKNFIRNCLKQDCVSRVIINLFCI